MTTPDTQAAAPGDERFSYHEVQLHDGRTLALFVNRETRSLVWLEDHRHRLVVLEVVKVGEEGERKLYRYVLPEVSEDDPSA